MPRKSASHSKKNTSSPPEKKRPSGQRSGSQRSGSNLQRLQRVLAAAGYGSRRQCEELIVEGRVEVDGQTVTELGTQVDPKEAKIYVDGSLLKRERPAYFVVNKPPGVVTTNRDPQGRTRVIDLVQERQRLFPVGRLDRSSEGLILLTNDGDLAQQLAHPRYGVRKIYRVTVAGKVDNDKLSQMKRGIFIAEGRVHVDGAKILRHRGKATELEILLREGKNREIRRILARLGHKVLTLQRIALGPLRLGELPRGAYRPVTPDELRRLRDEIHFQSKQATAARSGDATADSDAGDKPAARRPAGRSAGKPAGRPGSQAAGGRAAKKHAGGTAGPPGGPPQRAKPPRRSRPLEDSKTVGTVIGGEDEPNSSRTSGTGRRTKAAGSSGKGKPAKGKRQTKKGRGGRR